LSKRYIVLGAGVAGFTAACEIRRMDPGIGFNMEMEDCLTLVARMGELKCGNYPLLMGMSNKRFLGWLTGAEPGQRESANLAAELFAAENGVGILRVHDVCSSRQALTVWQRLQERKN